MNANELRVGVYIYDEENNICRIEAIASDRQHKWCSVSSIIDGFDKIYFSNIYPIPLTEKLLLTCGAKKDEYDEFTYSYFALEYRKERKAWKVSEKGHHMAYVTYLHQLQNLYFALTGEELEVKL